ncbi:phage tail protein [Yersinia enterocolitica]|uniref:glycine-rich domain-containing protein n=1 Tax=Yersinia enterocolitica TaxID=630 RepID=UPI003CFC5D5F
MIAIAKLAASVMGSNTYLNGLACTASSPASMVINIAPGEIYSLQNIDSTAYSSLPADTAHSILKQGILLSATSFTLAAPSTAGQSINYLIQVAFQDVDSGATVLPYYNASNPSQAYSGPNNSGIAQNTIRSGVCSVSVKTGVSATTGSQVTPPPDAGYVGAYVVTVNQGQTTITSTSINLAANAPFLPKNGLVSGVQSNTMNYSADTGTANNYVASYFPAVTQLTDGLRLTFKAKNSNTASSTFSPNGLASAPIYTRAAGALTGGEIAQNKIMEVEWNSTLSAWTLISGSDPLAIGALQKSANLSEIKDAGPAAVAQTLLNLGLLGGINSSAVGRLLNVQKISSSQAYTKTPGAKFGIVEVVGGGGAGGSPAQNGSGYTSGSGGGNSGCYVRFLVDLSSVDYVSCIIGAGGTPVTQQEGGMGGNTAFGSYATVPGGNGGLLLASATSTNRIYGMSPPRGNFGSINNAVLLDYNYGGLGGDAVIMSSGARAGFGGASKLGGQTFGPGNDTPGINATTYGGGGSGVVATSATQGTNLLGGNGAGGVIIVWEYA